MSTKTANPSFNYSLIALALVIFIYQCRPLFNPDAVAKAINSGQSIVAFVISNLLIALWITLPVSALYVYCRKNYPNLIRNIQYGLLLLYCLYGWEFLKAMLDAFQILGSSGLSGTFGFYHAFMLIMLDLALVYLYFDNKPDKQRFKLLSLSAQSVLFLLIWAYSLSTDLMLNTI